MLMQIWKLHMKHVLVEKFISHFTVILKRNLSFGYKTVVKKINK